jgi:hypothetical protein
LTRNTHTVSVPFSAAERRLILETAKLDDEIAERLDEIDPREEVVSLTIAELVRLAIATAGDPTRLSAEADRNMLARLSDRLHQVVGNCLRSEPLTQTGDRLGKGRQDDGKVAGFGRGVDRNTHTSGLGRLEIAEDRPGGDA